jgi:hypothetical protein
LKRGLSFVTKNFIFLMSCGVLAACGGSTTTSSFVAPTGPAGLNNRIAEADALVDLLQPANQADWRRGALANPGGSATFDGAMSMTVDPDVPGDTFYGDANITVDFASNSASGTVDDFYYYDTSGANGTTGQTATGSLTLAASALVFDDTATTAVEGFDTTITGALDINQTAGDEAVTGSNFNIAFAGEDGDDSGFVDGAEYIDMLAGTGTVTIGGTTFQSTLVACSDDLGPTTCP